MNRSFRRQETLMPSIKPRVSQLKSVNTTAMREKEDDLALFLEMRKLEKEKNDLLLQNYDQFDDTLVSQPGSSPLFNVQAKATVVVRKTGAEEFLNSDGEKNDYDWLLTPPGTPLFPSLDMESRKAYMNEAEAPKVQPTVLRSRLANSQTETTGRSSLLTRQPTSSTGLNSSVSGLRRPSSSGGPGSRPPSSGGPGSRPVTPGGGSSRPATPTGRSSLTSSKPSRSSTPTSRGTVTSSKPAHSSSPKSSSTRPTASVPSIRSAVPSRSSTPSRASTITKSSAPSAGPSRSSTPTRSTTRSATPTRSATTARSSTPTSRPSVPSSRPASRASTPTRRPSAPSSVPSVTASLNRSSSSISSKSVGSAPSRSAAPSRGSSPTVRSRPWNPSEMPGFSLDAPPNLRTTLPDRPLSATRGRPAAPSPRSASVEPVNNGRIRRQSCSPSRGRAPNAGIHSSGSSVPAVNRGHSKVNDDVSPVVIGTKMVERVINMRKLAPPRQDSRHSPSLSGKSASPDSSGFGRTLSKKSLDMAIRHMDIRRSTHGNLRPLMTKIPASSMYSVRSGPTGSRTVSVSDSPLATSSNASSEQSVNNHAAVIDGHISELEDDLACERRGDHSSPTIVQNR